MITDKNTARSYLASSLDIARRDLARAGERFAALPEKDYIGREVARHFGYRDFARAAGKIDFALHMGVLNGEEYSAMQDDLFAYFTELFYPKCVGV